MVLFSSLIGREKPAEPKKYELNLVFEWTLAFSSIDDLVNYGLVTSHIVIIFRRDQFDLCFCFFGNKLKSLFSLKDSLISPLLWRLRLNFDSSFFFIPSSQLGS